VCRIYIKRIYKFDISAYVFDTPELINSKLELNLAIIFYVDTLYVAHNSVAL